MERFYEDVGGKLKRWAMWTFLLEAIAAVITGIALILSDADNVWIGFPVLIFGPLAAWVMSWLLYALGELVEKTAKNEQNTAKMLALMEGGRRTETVPEGATPTRSTLLTMEDCWNCKGCGARNLNNRSKCWRCGKEDKS